MKNWNQLLIRHGWRLNQVGENQFCCKWETEANMEFLRETLEKGEIAYEYGSDVISFLQEPVTEEEWIELLDFRYRGVGEGLWFQSEKEEPKVRELDTYISGIVRQLNRLGLYTNGSCDGNGKRRAHVCLVKGKDIEQRIQMLSALGIKRTDYRERAMSYDINFPSSRMELLNFAEKLSVMDTNWLEQGSEYIKKQMFNRLLEDLLSIPGASGDEERIRDFVKEKLTPFVDHITVDRHGNLLADKTYKSGNGPTILLNAHLDTVYEIESNRTIIKEGHIWSSSAGILGADDRAGIAVILHMAEQLMDSNFSGKVKFIFTVEEEIGLVGAKKVDPYFLWGTDAAIVVDRRGTGDIVTSCGGYIPFCDEAFGNFMERIAQVEGMDHWACTNGGSSDTRIWAEHGIQSVNLSAGYQNEHKESETLDVEACYEVTKLINAVFTNERELRRIIREIKRSSSFVEVLERR